MLDTSSDISLDDMLDDMLDTLSDTSSDGPLGCLTVWQSIKYSTFPGRQVRILTSSGHGRDR